MARILEAKVGWTFTGTTGGGKAYRLSPEASEVTVYFTTDTGTTATMQLQTCAGSSAGPWAGLGASTAMSTDLTVVHQFSGPLEWVRPYWSGAAATSSDVVTVRLIAN